jgi:hypothetical protein
VQKGILRVGPRQVAQVWGEVVLVALAALATIATRHLLGNRLPIVITMLLNKLTQKRIFLKREHAPGAQQLLRPGPTARGKRHPQFDKIVFLGTEKAPCVETEADTYLDAQTGCVPATRRNLGNNPYCDASKARG